MLCLSARLYTHRSPVSLPQGSFTSFLKMSMCSFLRKHDRDQMHNSSNSMTTRGEQNRQWWKFVSFMTQEWRSSEIDVIRMNELRHGWKTRTRAFVDNDGWKDPAKASNGETWKYTFCTQKEQIFANRSRFWYAPLSYGAGGIVRFLVQ